MKELTLALANVLILVVMEYNLSQLLKNERANAKSRS